MDRPNRRTLFFVALATVGSTGAILGGSLAGGCAFNSSASPMDSVCGAIGSYVQSCGSGTTCQAAVVRDCTKVTASMSAPAFDALFDCATTPTTTTCNAPSPLSTSCFFTNFANELAVARGLAQTNPAPAQLASDYCKACDPTNAQCATTFYAATPLVDGGATEPPLAIAGDTTLQDIDSKCVPPLVADAGAAACKSIFHACADPILAAGVYLPAECASGAAPPASANDGG